MSILLKETYCRIPQEYFDRAPYRPAKKEIDCFAIVIPMVIVFSFSGCNPATSKFRRSDQVAGKNESYSASQCSAHCFHESIYFGCAALGTDSVPSTNALLRSADDVFQYLEGQARHLGIRMYRVSVREGIQSLNGRIPCSTILVDRGGHLHTIIRQHGPDHAAYVQVVHGDGNGKLMAKKQLEGGEFLEAWRIDRGPVGIPIDVGVGTVVVDELVQDLGEIPPGQTKSFNVRIRNSGQAPILLTRAKTSCACTTVEDVAGVRISRGSTYNLTVSLTATEAESQRQQIELDFCSPRDEAIVTRHFTVFCSQRSPTIPNSP